MKRIGCWWWAGGGIALLGLLVAGAILWFYSDADLRRVQAEARAAGLATTWDEAGFRDMSVAERTVLDRVLSAARKQVSLTETDFQKAPRHVEPPNDALVAYHAVIPAEFWVELDAALGALPNDPLPLFKVYSPTTPYEVINEQRRLVRLLAERIRLCPTADLPARVGQAARVVHLVQSQTLIQELVDISCASILYPAVAARRDDLRGNVEAHLVASHLRALRDRLWHARLETWRGEGSVMFTAYADICRLTSLTPASSTGSFWERAEEWARSVPRPIVHRLNREAGLRHLISIQVAVNSAADPADLVHRSAAVPQPEPMLPWLAELSGTSPFPLGGPTT